MLSSVTGPRERGMLYWMSNNLPGRDSVQSFIFRSAGFLSLKQVNLMRTSSHIIGFLNLWPQSNQFLTGQWKLSTINHPPLLKSLLVRTFTGPQRRRWHLEKPSFPHSDAQRASWALMRGDIPRVLSWRRLKAFLSPSPCSNWTFLSCKMKLCSAMSSCRNITEGSPARFCMVLVSSSQCGDQANKVCGSFRLLLSAVLAGSDTGTLIRCCLWAGNHSTNPMKNSTGSNRSF